MICENCIHSNVCTDLIDDAIRKGSCSEFLDERLIIKLPCIPGENLYFIEKDCDSCEQLRTSMFTDDVECKMVNNADLYEPIINCETCKKYLKIKKKKCKDYMYKFAGAYTSKNEAKIEIEILKNI